MSSLLTEFMGQIGGLSHPETLRQAMGRFADDLGFESFMFMRVDCSTGENLILSNYSREWLDHYVSNDYSHLDPVVQRAQRSTTSFRWGESNYLDRLHGPQRRLFDEAGEFGIRHGVCTVWTNSGGTMNGMSLATNKSEAEFGQLLDLYRGDLELVSLYFCGHVENRVARQTAWRADSSLSMREKDCLKWTAQGLTVSEIAEVLGETQPVVVARLSSSVAKLGTYDVPHAAAKAVEMGLIYP